MTGKDTSPIEEHYQEWLGDRQDEQIETLEGLLDHFRKWLYLEETEDIEVALAALLDREIAGDPIWLQTIAPSGDKKTEVYRSFSEYHKAYSLDTLTTKTLISGLTRKNKETGELEPVAGLLKHINGKVLIIKDFTTTLAKSKEFRTELYGQLRSIYDGYYEVGFGTLPHPIRVECKIGFLAACTPIIDRYTRLETALGTRFLKIRSESDPIKSTKKALANAMQGDRMRTTLRTAVKNFIKALHEKGAFESQNLPSFTEDQKQDIIELATFISKMRATVWAKYDSSGGLYTIEAINEEKPTRAAKQLMKLAMLLAIIRGHSSIESSDINTLRRVARDTAIPTRQKIIDVFHSYGHLNAMLTVSDIEGITRNMGKRIHYRTAHNELEVMETLGIVDKHIEENERGRVLTTYTINQEFRGLVNQAYAPTTRVTSKKKLKQGLFSEVTPGEGSESLAEDLKLLLITLHNLQEDEVHGPVTHDILRERLKWGDDRFSGVLKLALLDDAVYEPRPGLLGVTW